MREESSGYAVVRGVATAVTAVLLVTMPTASPAQTGPCTASKLKAAAKYAAKRLGCYAKNVKSGTNVTECVGAAGDKLANAFTKADDNAGPCTGDFADAKTAIDYQTALIASALAAGSGRKCDAGKARLAGKITSKKLACQAKAAKAGGTTPEVECLEKVDIKAVETYAKVDDYNSDCSTWGDTQTYRDRINKMASDLRTEMGIVCAAKKVFVTSTQQTGAFGGLAGGDAICSTRATAAGLSGTYKAWLSTDTTSASARISHSTCPYVLPSGVQVADNYDDLVTGPYLDHSLNETEAGAVVSGSSWTGTLDDGSNYANNNCNNWTSTTAYGNNSAGWFLQHWSRGDGGSICSSTRRLFCFQQ